MVVSGVHLRCCAVREAGYVNTVKPLSIILLQHFSQMFSISYGSKKLCMSTMNNCVWHIVHNYFHEVLRVLDASIVVHGGNILLFVDHSATHPQDM